MNIRLFKEEDYEMVCKWWGFHGLDPIPMGFLPAYGYVAHEGDRDIAVAWLDISEFGVHCYVWGFLTGDMSTPEMTLEAHDAIMESMELFAQNENFSIMVNMPHQRSLKKLAEKSGFIENHDVCQMFKFIKQKGAA